MEATGWYKIFANHISKSNCAQKNIKNTQNSIVKKKETIHQIMIKIHDEHLTEEDIWMANKHMKGCSSSLLS